ncbi:hypothetical protein NONI108955_34305 [Nocardia ninae]|uniref:SprT-like domain-containing protein n=1 Tax=Nocardia ninae NBRC 108245 TaxID=1210091 RepID=A0A511MTG1_9NOCA|nr:hypothetical protein [Nocardia ninae]GEM43346.1 hypothetical protein NN4_78650 [Nocardia ninae NBRC 108245]
MDEFAGSVVVTAIEQTWSVIRAHHPDVPKVVVTVGAGSVGSPRGIRLGQFGPDRWQRGEQWMPELFVGGEGFAQGARDVLATMLHEAAHGVARTRGVQDTSRAGAYHNARYQTIAQELGLSVTREPHRGWSATTLPEPTASQYHSEIEALAAVLTARRRSEHEPPPRDPTAPADDADDTIDEQERERAPRSGRALVCACDPVRRVRAAQRTITAGRIFCGFCNELFRVDQTTQDA